MCVPDGYFMHSVYEHYMCRAVCGVNCRQLFNEVN